jgi:hypothetical protein
MPRMLRIVGRSSGKNYRRLRGPVSPSTALRDAQRHVTSGLGTPIVSIAVPHRMRGRVEVNPRRSSLNATAHRRRLTTPHAFHFCLKYPLGVRGGAKRPQRPSRLRALRAQRRDEKLARRRSIRKPPQKAPGPNLSTRLTPTPNPLTPKDSANPSSVDTFPSSCRLLPKR